MNYRSFLFLCAVFNTADFAADIYRWNVFLVVSHDRNSSWMGYCSWMEVQSQWPVERAF